MVDEIKKFVFLYPQQQIFDFEVRRFSILLADSWAKTKRGREFAGLFDNARSKETKRRLRARARVARERYFAPRYYGLLNRCIEQRYRRRGFQIVYALLDGEEVSPFIDKRLGDQTIYVGMDAKRHRTQREDGTYPYPDQNYIVNQFIPVDKLWVGGFHMWDCVQKLAIRAWVRGIDVKIDEDLTELLAARFRDNDFRIGRYVPYTPDKSDILYDLFMDSREGKPWFVQRR